MPPIITVENLGKKYIIGGKPSSQGLRHQLEDFFSNPFKRFRRSRDEEISANEFWALKNVSFDVEQGDVVGIIGKNGAGKSTLLKILSRITEPTEGRIRIRGRVASLLEVGTGFHPELTGRENIFLNGAILGMTRAEIKSKFDEIVAFAEIERFIDTPVKRYSSGMYVRLAFAVAAHLEPEILVVDEVLAVGDAEFQKKCLGKMQDVSSKEGRTVMFVSHNMGAIEQLCDKAIMFSKGRVADKGSDMKNLVRKYLNIGCDIKTLAEWTNQNKEYQNPWFHPVRFVAKNSKGEVVHSSVRNDEDIYIEVEGVVEESETSLTMGYSLNTLDTNQCIYITYHTDTKKETWPNVKRGKNILRSQLPKRFLGEGDYVLYLMGGLHNREWITKPGYNSPCIHLSIKGGLSDSPYWTSARHCLMAPIIPWNSLRP